MTRNQDRGRTFSVTFYWTDKGAHADRGPHDLGRFPTLERAKRAAALLLSFAPHPEALAVLIDGHGGQPTYGAGQRIELGAPVDWLSLQSEITPNATALALEWEQLLDQPE